MFETPPTLGISVIICTLNRAESLRKTLESLRRLDIPPDLDYEILVVDNGSTDDTCKLLKELTEKDPDEFRYFVHPKKGKSRALNIGIEKARGNIFAFTDDDVVVDRNWIRVLRDTFNTHREVIAVQGRILLQEEIRELPEWVNPKDLLFCPYYAPDSGPCYCDTLVGANMAIRRTAFENYGLFDPRLGSGASGLGEETEFCARLKEHGEKILYQPDVVAFHEYCKERFTWEYWCKRTRQHAHSNAIIDVMLKQKKISQVQNWRKLLGYYMQYSFHALLDGNRKKRKYDRKIRYLRSYMRYVSELRKGPESVPKA